MNYTQFCPVLASTNKSTDLTDLILIYFSYSINEMELRREEKLKSPCKAKMKRRVDLGVDS